MLRPIQSHVPNIEGPRSSDVKFCVSSIKIHTSSVLYQHGYHHEASIFSLTLYLLVNRNVSSFLCSFNEYLLKTIMYQAPGYRQSPQSS